MAARGSAKLLSVPTMKRTGAWVPEDDPFPPVNWGQVGKLLVTGTAPETTGQIWP